MNLFTSANRRLTDFLEQRKAVRQLSRLDDRMLKDIGVSRSAIHAAVSGRSIGRDHN
jgi:uncharacterized protein YjiS (DUF1127 family)